MTDLTSLPQLEVEIKFYLGQTAQNIIEVGKRLIQAKSIVQHGQWQQWLNDNFQLSKSTAYNFIQCAERYGNFQSIGNLNSTQMIALLSLPDAEETERFIEQKAAEGKAVADMTIRELRKEIAGYKKQLEDKDTEFQQSLFDLRNEHAEEIADVQEQFDKQIQDLKKELKDRPTVVPIDYDDTKQELVDAKVALERAKDAAEKQAETFKEQSDAASRKIGDLESKVKKLEKANERLKEKSYTPPIDLPIDKFKLFRADIRDGLSAIDDNSVDFIITDPPYPKEYLPLYEDLSKLAARVLKDGGSLICMTGQSYLPDVIQLLATNMTYHWCMCYSTPGQKTQLWQKNLHTAWKPLLWFVKGKYTGDWLGSDVMTSPAKDKTFHKWGQSDGGMTDIIERLTKPDDVILDPFLGGGTTGIAALVCGRKFIGVDIEQGCLDTTQARLKEAFENV